MAKGRRRRKRHLGAVGGGCAAKKAAIGRVKGNSASAKKRRGKALARYLKCLRQHGMAPRRRSRRGKK